MSKTTTKQKTIPKKTEKAKAVSAPVKSKKVSEKVLSPITLENDVRINNVFKGAGLHFTLENCEVVKNNLSKPYHNAEFDSYSSSVGILLTDEIKKEIYDLLANSFSKEEGLSLALKNFLEKKVTVLEDGQEIFYASVKWKNNAGKLTLAKPLPIHYSDGVEESQTFPYHFKGTIQVGFSYSQKHTFAVYLNAVLVQEVISYESAGFSGLKTDKFYNPTLEAEIKEARDESEPEEKAETKNGKSESVVEKIKKKKFW